MASHVDVVVFDENELVRELWVAHHQRDFLQHPLAGIITGMRLTGEHELYGPLGIIDHGGEFLPVAQEQISALVGGEAARETDGQCVEREYAAKPFELVRRLVATLRLA